MPPDFSRDLEIPLGGRLDAQRPEQLGRGSARIAGLAENRMQALVGKVPEHQVHDAPRIEGLVLRFAWRVHGVPPRQRVPPRRYTRYAQSGTGGLNLRHRFPLRSCYVVRTTQTSDATPRDEPATRESDTGGKEGACLMRQRARPP